MKNNMAGRGEYGTAGHTVVRDTRNIFSRCTNVAALTVPNVLV